MVNPDTTEITAANNMVISSTPKNQPIKVTTSMAEGKYKLYHWDKPENESEFPVHWEGADSLDSEYFTKNSGFKVDEKDTHTDAHIGGDYQVDGIILDKPSATDTVTVEYGVIGTYKNKPVTAKVVYSNIIVDNENKLPALTFSSNLSMGQWRWNIKQLDSMYTFYYEDGSKVELEGDSFLGINSLDLGEYGWYKNASDYYVTDKTFLTETQNPLTNDGTVMLGTGKGITDPTDTDYTDEVGASTFTKETVSFKVSGTDHLFTYGTADGRQWWATSSATLFNVVPEKPTKSIENTEGEDIDGGKVKPGQEVTYKISQKVNTLGVDLLTKYKSMTFVDKLPEEVTYVDSELQDESGKKVDETGMKELDEATNTLTYKVSPDYLQNGMKYNAETYTLNVNVKVKDDVKDGVVLKNIANVTINENSQDTNEVTVTPEIDPPVTPEPKPEPKPEVPEPVQEAKPVTLPATGGMDLNTKYTLGFVVLLTVVGAISGTIIYVIKKRA